MRPWAEDDVGLLGQLASDPLVMRYIGDGQPWPPERTQEVGERWTEHWRVHDFGWRVPLLKQTSDPVGFAALNYLGPGTAGLDPSEVEIGWWLAPPRWRQGLASEAAQAMCEEAFGRVGAPSIVARLQPRNRASAAVAERLGMRHEFDTTGRFGEGIAVYRLGAEEWEA